MLGLGAHKERPYVSDQVDETVNMVWHDHKRAELNIWKTPGQIFPFSRDHASNLVQPHLVLLTVAEEAKPVLDHDCHEISAAKTVIVPFQTD